MHERVSINRNGMNKPSLSAHIHKCPDAMAFPQALQMPKPFISQNM